MEHSRLNNFVLYLAYDIIVFSMNVLELSLRVYIRVNFHKSKPFVLEFYIIISGLICVWLILSRLLCDIQ